MTLQKFLKELGEESAITRKMLQIVPNDKYGWQPHPKSMTIKSLVTHIAELPSWIGMTLNTSGLDFSTTPYNPESINNTEELMAYFEKTLAEAQDELWKGKDAELNNEWTLRNGDHIISTRTKEEVLRMVLNQITHHRAQLGVDLRLLNIPIPGSYGPSADEMGK
jgi:uncharacterized damage-inducible protein DinB